MNLGSWPFWIAPSDLVLDYLIKMAIFLVVVPMVFGVVYTPMGLFLNYLFLDFLIYLQYKRLTRN